MDTSNIASTSTSVSAGSTRLPFVVVCKELYCLIRSVKKMQLITTLDEVMDGLKIYICQKKLFDPLDPARICCKDDELGTVFGTSEFTVYEVKNFLLKLVSPISNKDSAGAIRTFSLTESAKRKFNELDEDEGVKQKLCMLNPGSKKCPSSPMILQIPPSPVLHLTSDSSDSVQGYETAFVKDTSDDTWSVEDSTDILPGDSIVAIGKTYNLEYEVDTDSSTDQDSNCESDTDSESDVRDALKTAIILVCKTDSDMECWADNSSDDEYGFDAEISESDQWKCNRCGSLNKPPMRFCLKCWDQRTGWLPEKQYVRKFPLKRKQGTKRKRLASKSKKTEHYSAEEIFTQASLSSNQCDVASTSQESLEASHSSQETACMSPDVSAGLNNCDEEAKRLCILCCSKPANASIIHGKYAHQISCYQCARKLQRQKKRCPICRRTIDKVVYQISTV